MINYVKIKIK